MNHVWWRTHLRKLPETGAGALFEDFPEADAWMPFLVETLDLPPGGRVLDLGCGLGAYSVRLAQWGYQVTAIDEAEPMLAAAREAASRRGAELEFRNADPRALPERRVYDGALLLDFGTYSDPDNAAIMRAVAGALKPGGKVIFGTLNPYYWSREPRTDHHTLNGTDVIRRYRFDFPTGTVVSSVRCIRAGGERQDLPTARYRAYTLPELRALTSAVGLADMRVFGEDEDGQQRPDCPLDTMRTPCFHCVALRPVTGEAGEGI